MLLSGPGCGHDHIMQLVGHGIDVVEVSRIERLLARDRDAFIGWLSDRELVELGERAGNAQVIAGRIAAKEAVAKALGTGFTGDVSWQDIEIRTTTAGAPAVELSGGAAVAAQGAGVRKVLLSVSHQPSLAIASAIAIG